MIWEELGTIGPQRNVNSRIEQLKHISESLALAMCEYCRNRKTHSMATAARTAAVLGYAAGIGEAYVATRDDSIARHIRQPANPTMINGLRPTLSRTNEPLLLVWQFMCKVHRDFCLTEYVP